MRNRVTYAASLALMAGVVFACGGAPAGTGRPGTSVAVPSIAVPSLSLPSFELPSFSIPSFSVPSFAPDPAIEAAFPSDIGGNPVEGVQSGSLLAFLQALFADGEQVTKFVQGMQSINVNPATVGFGTATVAFDDEPVQLQVIRFPGGHAGQALDVLVAIDEPDDPPTMTQQSIGGKTVTVATDSDGDVEYYYVNGEWAWFLPSATPEQAATIFAALP